MGSRLVFTPSRHTYALDGTRVPGVTTVINRATDKPALVYAAAKETARWAVDHTGLIDVIGPASWERQAASFHRDVWNAKGKRGTLLHDAARQLVAGDPITPETDGEPWPDDVVASAEQLARFMDEWDVDPLFTERPVFHETDRWAGTLDLVAKLRDGRRWLLDYKTGETGIYPKDALQLAAYRHATHIQVDTAGTGLMDRPMPDVDIAGCVWVRPEGYELRPVRSDDAAYLVFRSMLPVSAWMGWAREDSVSEPLPIPAAAS
jgi:hypothetical protein